MTDADRAYQSLPGIRWSRLKHMLTSAAHYKHACDAKEGPETTARRLGRAIHCALLEPEAFKSRWVTWTGKVRNGKAWEAFKLEHADREIMSVSESRLVVASAAAIRRHRTALLYLRGAREMTLTWTDAETGLPCKLRLDLLCARRLLDVKSTGRLDPRTFGRTCAALSYHGQLAFYMDGLAACGIEVDPEPIILAVETSAPFDVVPFEVPKVVVDAGRSLYRGLLHRVKECLDADSWPGRSPDGMMTLEFPTYALPESELDMTGVEGFDAPATGRGHAPPPEWRGEEF